MELPVLVPVLQAEPSIRGQLQIKLTKAELKGIRNLIFETQAITALMQSFSTQPIGIAESLLDFLFERQKTIERKRFALWSKIGKRLGLDMGKSWQVDYLTGEITPVRTSAEVKETEAK